MPRRFVRIIVFLLLIPIAWSQHEADQTWKFAVSGDSRNCGDVVMPAIARSVREHQAEFYWHMGDFRLMDGVDEDMQKRYGGNLGKVEYWKIAWGDFLANQVAPFGTLPVHLGIGNHEIAGNKTTEDYLAQFAYWMDTPEARVARLSDNSQNTALKTYYHWKERGIDFIYLDNARADGFDEPQLQWLESVLERDKADSEVKTVVVGMHRALSNSLACGHSMNGDVGHENAKSIQSGRQAYGDLLRWKKEAKKFLYVLATHSHFFMENVYDTAYWRNPEHGGEVLPGWIVGTAGARRYRLPDLTREQLRETKAQTDVWGYLLATVEASGAIRFEFIRLGKDSVPPEVRSRYGDDFVDNFCFLGNRDNTPHPPPDSCKEQ